MIGGRERERRARAQNGGRGGEGRARERGSSTCSLFVSFIMNIFLFFML